MTNAEQRSDFIQTRCPAQIITYQKTLAVLRYGKLMTLHQEMLRQFIDSRPWAAEPPLHWRIPSAPQAMVEGLKTQTGWKTFNVHVTPHLKEEVENLCGVLGVSMSTFCYTAIYWWVKYIMPPKSYLNTSEG
ncbi:hypothetical protein [Burkholderia sp. LMG 13014]|uniref:hypothetical protein n=1 Tax=Burkholderia sp. LMG 13014 TaxID=2709306 RepID=UPI00196572D1|nr:hypothetical protein [Burkholderia sp. LMG 13014]